MGEMVLRTGWSEMILVSCNITSNPNFDFQNLDRFLSKLMLC